MDPRLDVQLYREKRPELKAGKWLSVMQDRGDLFEALAASTGDFLFSEKGAGLWPLVAFGSPRAILTYFANKSSAVVNTIVELPELYLGVDYFIPRERFEGLFPVQSALQNLVRSGTSFVPGSTITDLAGAIADCVNTGIDISRRGHRARLDADLLYLKLSYLPEEGLARVGTSRMSFAAIAEVAFDAFAKAGMIKKG